MDTLATFERLLGRDFRVDDSMTLILRTAEALPSSARAGGGFRLEFVAPDPLVQATYRMECDGERFDIFIVPIAREGSATVLEAIFN